MSRTGYAANALVPMAVTPTPTMNAVAYTAASRSHPDMRAWSPSLGSPDNDILPELPVMASRSRDLLRNHGVASGALQTLDDNILGTGLWMVPTPNLSLLGWDEAYATAWCENVKAHWRNYADTPHCDAARTLTLDGLASLAFRGAFYNGDSLALPLWVPDSYSPAATRIQVIESDRLSNPNNQPDRVDLRGGIRLDPFGAPMGYWIRKMHPGDQFIAWNSNTIMDWEYIPAFTAWGRRRVVHLHDKQRAGQTRAAPALSSVLRQFKVLGDYQNAELKAAVVNAMVAIITESSLSQEQMVELLSGDSDAISKYMDSLNAQKRGSVEYNAGAVLPLQMGEKFSSFTPGRPSTAFDAFTTTVFRHIATGLNIPYELLMKDFSKTNYSSARASLLEAWRFFSGRRAAMAQYFYQPIYELWFEEMVDRGEIEAPNFYEMRAAYCCARWYGPGRGWVDPVKEGMAAVLRMQNNLSTLEAECAEQGRDWQDVLRQRAREKAFATSLGLDLTAASTPPKPSVANSGTEEPAADNTDGGDQANEDGTNGEDPVDKAIMAMVSQLVSPTVILQAPATEAAS